MTRRDRSRDDIIIRHASHESPLDGEEVSRKSSRRGESRGGQRRIAGDPRLFAKQSAARANRGENNDRPFSRRPSGEMTAAHIDVNTPSIEGVKLTVRDLSARSIWLFECRPSQNLKLIGDILYIYIYVRKRKIAGSLYLGLVDDDSRRRLNTTLGENDDF